MRLANITNRLTLVTPTNEIVDIADATGGTFSPAIQECYERWDELLEVAPSLHKAAGKPLSHRAGHTGPVSSSLRSRRRIRWCPILRRFRTSVRLRSWELPAGSCREG